MTKEEISKLIYAKPHIVKCYKCGKTMEIPNLMNEETRDNVLSPFCWSYMVFVRERYTC